MSQTLTRPALVPELCVDDIVESLKFIVHDPDGYLLRFAQKFGGTI
jgi:hypothetical protein